MIEPALLGLAIPTYRRQDQLSNLLASVPSDVAVFVSDNGATLTTDFKARQANARFTSCNNVVPMFTNWNLAARMADTDWVMVPSDDDIYYPDSFRIIREALQCNADADMVVFGHHVVDEHYRVLSTWQPAQGVRCEAPDGFSAFACGVEARMPSIAFRKNALIALDYFDARFKLTAADSDLIQRAALAGTVVFVPQVVSGYRTWAQNGTSQTIATLGWLDEIELWGAKLQARLAQVPKFASRASAIPAELYAQNLLAGISQLRREGRFAEARAHFRRAAYPGHARWITQFRICYQLLKSMRRLSAKARPHAGPT